MKVNQISKGYKNIKRYKEIISVLKKYGFSILVEKINIKHNKIFFRKSNKIIEEYTRGERIRFALEELGPTFIKLGQILSTRYDILPPDIAEELNKLQDKVSEFPLEEARNIFRDEFGKEVEEVFDDFNVKPIASASIGQVYTGKLKSGEGVVIKIQRPNIKKLIETDIQILYSIASLIDEHFNKMGVVKASDVVQEFSYYIKKEINYKFEAQNYENFRLNFSGNNNVIVPKVFWEYTSTKVLVLEEINGVKVNNIKEIEKRGWNKKQIAKLGAKLFMKQVFIHGYFHADPHPGNILIVNEEKICFIDFGIVGYIDEVTLKFVTTFIRAGNNKNIENIVDLLKRMGSITADTNESFLKRDIFFLVNYYFNVPINKIKLSEALNEILIMSYKHKVRMPAQLTLLIKAIIIAEGTGKKLNPEFNFVDIVNDMSDDLISVNFKPKKIFNELLDYTYENATVFKQIPKKLNTLFSKLEKNKVKIKLTLEGLKTLEKEINSMTNKISLSLIVSALIVGSSIVIQAESKPQLFGMSAIGLIGYSIGAIMGIFLVLSIIWSIWNNGK